MDGKKSLVLLVMIALFLAACAQPERGFDSFAAEEAPPFEPAVEAEADFATGSVANISSDIMQTSLQAGDLQERLIIRDGNMTIVVEDTDQALTEIVRLAAAKNGWVVDSSVYQSNGGKSGTITIRVPAGEFDATMAEIRELALEVESESTTSQDVTEEFVDLEARVANLEATADRVRGFLDEAKTVEEALAVNAELSRLEGEIESLKARMKFLSESAAFSRLTVQVTPDELSQPIEVGGWRPQGVALSAIEALISALQSLANVLIWGVIFCLPLAILVGVPAFFVIRFGYRRWRRRKGEPAAEAGEEAPGEMEAEEAAARDEDEG